MRMRRKRWRRRRGGGKEEKEVGKDNAVWEHKEKNERDRGVE